MGQGVAGGVGRKEGRRRELRGMGHGGESNEDGGTQELSSS